LRHWAGGEEPELDASSEPRHVDPRGTRASKQEGSPQEPLESHRVWKQEAGRQREESDAEFGDFVQGGGNFAEFESVPCSSSTGVAVPVVFGEGEGGSTVAAASPSSLVGPPSSTDPSTDPLDDAFEAQRIDDPLYEGFIEGFIEPAGGTDGFIDAGGIAGIEEIDTEATAAPGREAHLEGREAEGSKPNPPPNLKPPQEPLESHREIPTLHTPRGGLGGGTRLQQEINGGVNQLDLERDVHDLVQDKDARLYL